ncbi:MAG: Phosphoserine phosphatase 1 [Anaerolineales bacterium]|nr:Phosphoserine phosphatase 1 [Anaerolineales bacterium]
MDVPLNQTGVRQAELLAKRLSTEKMDAIVTSDLIRAVETAKAVCALRENPPIIATDPRWRELSFGKWEGLNQDEIKAQWQDEAKVWYADIVHAVPPGGESLFQLSQRIGAALEDLKSEHKDKTVLLVTHSGVIQTMMCLILGMELKRYWQFRVLQASLTVIRFHEAGGAIELFNDCSHLKEMNE